MRQGDESVGVDFGAERRFAFQSNLYICIYTRTTAKPQPYIYMYTGNKPPAQMYKCIYTFGQQNNQPATPIPL
jgi:hypothetical protein